MDNIVYTKSDEYIAIIKLNRPDQLNALDGEMVTDLLAALQNANQAEDVRTIILTGEGKSFCAGGNLKKMAEGLKNSPVWHKEHFWNGIAQIPLTVKAIDKPIIAAINGPAVGAGMDLALMCDIRFMAEGAILSEGYINVGLVPAEGGAYFLPRIVGTAKALELLWTGEKITAEQALQLGIVNKVTAPERLLNEAVALAKRIASGPFVATRLIKRAVYQSLSMDLKASLDMITSHMALALTTEDYAEAIQAFLEKRMPHFRGK